MNGEESGGGVYPCGQTPPPILWAVAILVGAIAISIFSVGIHLLIASKIKNRFFISKAEMERRMRDQAKHKKEVKKLIYYLEKEIKAGDRAKDMILNKEIENEMSLETIQIIFKEKAKEFGDAVLHEKQLRNQMQKEITQLNKELEQVQHAREEASLFLCKLQSENESLKAAQRRILKQVDELNQRAFNEKRLKDEQEKELIQLNERLQEASRQLETEKMRAKDVECKLRKDVYALQAREQTEKLLREKKEAEFEEMCKNYEQLSETVKEATELLDEKKSLAEEKEEELRKLYAKLETAQEASKQAAELVSQLQNDNKLLQEQSEEVSQIYRQLEKEKILKEKKEAEFEEMRQNYEQLCETAKGATKLLDEKKSLSEEKEEELRKLYAKLETAQEASKQAAKLVSQLQNDNKLLQEQHEEEVSQIYQQLEKEKEVSEIYRQLEKEKILKNEKEEEARKLKKELEKASIESTNLKNENWVLNDQMQDSQESEGCSIL